MINAIGRAIGSLFSRKPVRASLDLVQTTHENKRHWKDADPLSARASFPRTVRWVARNRSRLEADNNSWYAGMLRTAANHIVGAGPRLQLMTDDAEFNARVERSWAKWWRAVHGVAKLKTAVQTYWRDGEVFGMRDSQPSLYPITLNFKLYEGDQVSQPYWHILDPTIEDGIRVDEMGNPVEYWIYNHHPGDLNIGHVNILEGNWYPSERVWHLFRADRPGQLRGIPRCAPAIDWLAHMRRFSKATLSAAEAAALWGVFIKTTSSQIAPANSPGDFMEVDFARNMMNFLPDGWEPHQLRADHPGTTNEQYQRSELTYFARCANMPYSLAAGTSRDSNFASAKMDIKNTWEPEVVGEQEALDRVVMRPLVRWFFEHAAIETDLLDGVPLLIDEIDYQFFWPPLPQSDEGDAAKATAQRLETGQSTRREEYARRGLNVDTEDAAAARDYGVTVEEYRRGLFNKLVAVKAPEQNSAPPGESTTPDEAGAADDSRSASLAHEEVAA